MTDTLTHRQVEYANKAVDNAGTVIGLRCKDGVVLAVEKLVQSKLLVPGANRRIATVDLHAGIVRFGFDRASSKSLSCTPLTYHFPCETGNGGLVGGW